MSAQVFEALAHPAWDPPRRGLPLAAAPSGERLAWQREMEKAQTRGWFHGPSRPRSPAPASVGPAPVGMAPGPLPRAARAVGAAPPLAAAMAGSIAPAAAAAAAARPGACGVVEALPSKPMPASRGPAGNGPRAAVAATPPRGPVASPAASPSAGIGLYIEPCIEPCIDPGREATQGPVHPGRSRLAGAGPREAVRVHVEESPAGLSVWLGVDGGVLPPGLRSALRHLPAASGLRIARVVCNGQQVPGLGAPPGAAPHPRFPTAPSHQET